MGVINEPQDSRKPPLQTLVKWWVVDMWDVGVRYGSVMRKKVKEYVSSANLEKESVDGVVKRRSPIPHFRCAHWQHYWINDENKKKIRILKWKEPKFVGGAISKDVVIHKVI